MQVFHFGSAFTINYYPMLDGVAFDPPAQTPAIYIWDEFPSDDDARNNTSGSAIEVIATWGEGTANIRTIVAAAIVDPEDGTVSKDYWVSVNYDPVTDGAGEAVVDIMLFRLGLPQGSGYDPTPSATEVKNEDASLTNYYADAVIDTYIAAAESRVKLKLKARKIVWEQIQNLDDVKIVITYQALDDMWTHQVMEADDAFDMRRKSAEMMFNNLFESLVLEYDLNEDDQLTEDEEEYAAISSTRLIR